MEKGKLSADDIILVLDKLIGGVCATGDSGVDGKILGNLETLIKVSVNVISKIVCSSADNDAPEHSVRLIGQTAAEYLEYVRTELERLELHK